MLDIHLNDETPVSDKKYWHEPVEVSYLGEGPRLGIAVVQALEMKLEERTPSQLELIKAFLVDGFKVKDFINDMLDLIYAAELRPENTYFFQQMKRSLITFPNAASTISKMFDSMEQGIEVNYQPEEIAFLAGLNPILAFSLGLKDPVALEVNRIVNAFLVNTVQQNQSSEDIKNQLKEGHIETILQCRNILEARKTLTAEQEIFINISEQALDLLWEQELDKEAKKIKIPKDERDLMCMLLRGGPSQAERDRFFNILKNLLGDKGSAFNQKLNVLKENLEVYQNKPPFNLHVNKTLRILEDCRRYTHKSRHLTSKQQYQRLENLFDGDTLVDTPKPDQRLSLVEAAIISDVADMHDFFEKYCRRITEGPWFMQMASRAAQFGREIEKMKVESVESHDTLLVFKSIRSKDIVKEHQESKTVKLTRKLVTPYGHTATVHKRNDKLIQEHLEASFQHEDPLNFRDFLYNELFRLDLSKLVDPKNHEAMKQLLGDDWETTLNSKYSEHERKVHDRSLTGNLTAAVADNAYKKIGAKAILLPKISDKNLKKWHLDKAMGKAMAAKNEENKVPMLCSQYTCYSTLIAIENLNIELNLLAKKQKVKCQKNMIKRPISDRQNMKTMHPGRLFKELHKRGCLKPLDATKVNRYLKS